MDAENTYQVFDWLWTSGQLSARDVAALPALGVELVINLALPTATNALRGEAELVTGLGMAYVQVPVVWEAPRVEQFAQFAGVVQAFRGVASPAGPGGVWLHCAKNYRASAFVYLYRRLVLDEGEEAASFPMHKIWTPNDVWREFIARVVAGNPPLNL